MQIAYPSHNPPENVLCRLDWPVTDDLRAILAGPHFERGIVSGTKSPVFSLRLGNVSYPHMKLQLQPWPTSVGYMLSVNTHDQVAGLDPESPDAASLRALQVENQLMKVAIENAWDAAGLPTFLRYLRDYVALSLA
jgi:hypothetical protein